MNEPSQRIRVLVVDDHAVVRGGLLFFLATMADIEVVGEATDGERALRMCERYKPHVVLMDLAMPQMDGIEATRLLRQRYPEIRVIVLTSYQEEDLVERALQAGAISYLLKDIPAKELGDAIRAAYVGRSTLAPEITQMLNHVVARPPKVGYDLTDREMEVLKLMTVGLSNAQIGERIMISRNTVRYHVRNILSKLHADNRTGAVALAMQHALIPVASEMLR